MPDIVQKQSPIPDNKIEQVQQPTSWNMKHISIAFAAGVGCGIIGLSLLLITIKILM